MPSFILGGWTLVGVSPNNLHLSCWHCSPFPRVPLQTCSTQPFCHSRHPTKAPQLAVAFMGISIPSKQIPPCHTWWVVPAGTGTPPDHLLPRVVGEPAPLSDTPQLLRCGLAPQAITCAAAIAGPLSQPYLFTIVPQQFWLAIADSQAEVQPTHQMPVALAVQSEQEGAMQSIQGTLSSA